MNAVPMNIVISKDKRISAIQEEFNTAFPYLKLEFYLKSHLPGKGSVKGKIRPDHKTLEDYQKGNTRANLVITPAITVMDLEQQFATLFGIGIQVFRKSGNVWLETTLTDAWTLKEQNDQGEALSKGRA